MARSVTSVQRGKRGRFPNASLRVKRNSDMQESTPSWCCVDGGKQSQCLSTTFCLKLVALCQVIYFSEVLGLTCSPQVALRSDFIPTWVTEIHMPHYSRIWAATLAPLFRSSYLPAKIWLSVSNSSGEAQTRHVILAAWFIYIFHSRFKKCKQSLRSCLGGEGAGGCWI